MEKTGNNAYIRNLLSLLNLRLFSSLGNCDAEWRGTAYDRIVDIADHTEQDAYAPKDADLQAYQALFDALMREQEDLLRTAEKDGLPEIEYLRDCFGLDANEMLLLTAVLAPYADSRFRQLYKIFQGYEAPRQDFLLGLIDPDGLGRYEFSKLLSREGKLLKFGLIEANGNYSGFLPETTFRPAPGLPEWLNAVPSQDEFDGRAAWLTDYRTTDLQDDKAIASVSAAVRSAEERNETTPIISFYGPDEELLTDHAKALSVELERPVLRLDLTGLELSDSFRLLRLALRDCMINEGLPVICGINQWVDYLGTLPAELGEFFAEWNVPVVLLSGRKVVFAPDRVTRSRLMLRIEVEELTGTQRLAVWKKQLENLPTDDKMDDETLRTLAGQFKLSSSQIHAAVNAGLGIAVTENRVLSVDDLYEGARSSSMHHLSDLAKQMPARYTIRDLILPEKQKQEIDSLIAMARNRSLVLEDWGVGKKLVSGRGLSALFTGVPGTGKTLAAQAIAGELGLDMYRVDLSTIVSKYIGETEKNLEKIFTEAQNSNVILFFDEADSLFGRRSEVNDSRDRYANIEVGYLLQRIEVYDGIVLMATNLGANLDEAFARRINYIIDFPFPDEETRLRLWQLLLPDNIEKEDDIDLASFAAAYKIAGGNIRNAVVWAIYDSARKKQPLSNEDLMHGVEREYQKMGKVFIPFK